MLSLSLLDNEIDAWKIIQIPLDYFNHLITGTQIAQPDVDYITYVTR